MAGNNSSNTKKSEIDHDYEVDVSFVVAVFDDVNAAKDAFAILKDLKREGLFNIIAAAYLEKTERSKLKMHEFKDWSGKKGALAGGTAGAILGIIGSAVLLPLAVGALIGGIFSKVHDTGFNDKELRNLGDSLPPGSSALIAIVEDDNVEQVEDELKKSGGKKVQSGEIPKSTYEPAAKAEKS